jgi:hypothetical protein
MQDALLLPVAGSKGEASCLVLQFGGASYVVRLQLLLKPGAQRRHRLQMSRMVAGET